MSNTEFCSSRSSPCLHLNDCDGTKKVENPQNGTLALNARHQLCKWMQMNPVFGSLQVLKSKVVGKLNILSIFQIILHKVRAPVTCWEVVVHHLRAVNGSDG